jgi:N-acetylglucosamine-6-phosphate deacetylase
LPQVFLTVQGMGLKTDSLSKQLAGVCLTGARLVGYVGLQQLWLDPQGLILDIQPVEAQAQVADQANLIDLGGDWLSLGGVDLQINGALGLAFPDVGESEDSDRQSLAAIAQFLWQQGVDAFLPTIVTTAVSKMQRSLAVFADLMSQAQPRTAQILGVHLEGPFLNPVKRGAHPQEFLLPLEVEQVKRTLHNYEAAVKVITLAPELDPTGAAIAYLRNQNIIVSLGHSLATAAEANQAFAQGATMVTHASNAMPGLHHREPGLLGAAIVHPDVWCGVIADGQHICPIMLEILLRTERDGQGFFLVSDALAPLGLPDGVYPWDSRQIQVTGGTARLPDGTLAGTTLSLLTGVKNLVEWGICDLETAIALATEAPRQTIGLPGLAIGQPGDNLLRWHQDMATGGIIWQRLFDYPNLSSG